MKKPKRVNVIAYACVTERGRVRYVHLAPRYVTAVTVAMMGDRIAKCRLVEIPKKRKVKK